MEGIDRDELPAVLLVSATVLLLGIVAATIDNVVGGDGGIDATVDSRFGGGIGGTNASLGNDSVGSQGPVGQGQTIDLVICLDVLTTTPAILGIVAGVGVVLLGIYRRYNGATSLLVGTAVVPIVWAVYFFLTNCMTSDSGGWTFLSGQSVMTNEGGVSSPSLPPKLVAGGIGIVVIAGLGLLSLITGSTDESLQEASEEPDTTGAAVARAAGRAADRIEATNAPVDNDVYRAWLEMTRLLDIENPETTAPHDFAVAASELGFNEDDVAELAELFTDVRYGGKGAKDREDRALKVLRRIQQTYQDADEGPGGTT